MFQGPSRPFLDDTLEGVLEGMGRRWAGEARCLLFLNTVAMDWSANIAISLWIVGRVPNRTNE